jgi:CheY-like chemotaxis protein
MTPEDPERGAPPRPPEIVQAQFNQALRAAEHGIQAVARRARESHGPRPALEEAVQRALADVARIEALVGRVAPGSRVARRFLVVDDSEDVRFVVARALRRLAPDAAVHVARDGGEALAALDIHDDGEGLTVISDHDMGPGPTGAQLLSEIAARHPKARRVLFTGHAPDRIAKTRVPPDAVIPKEGGMDSLRRFLMTT